MEQGASLYLVTRGIYSDERAAGVYPTLERAMAQFPEATWRGLEGQWLTDGVTVGHWPSGHPIIDAATIYEMAFDKDIVAR